MERILLLILSGVVAILIIALLLKLGVALLQSFIETTGKFITGALIIFGLILAGYGLLYPTQAQERINVIFDKNKKSPSPDYLYTY